MKKVISILLTVLMLTTVFTACGGASATASDTSATPNSAAGSVPAADGKLTIWIEKSFSDVANDLMDKRIQAFASEKGVEVKAEFIAATDYMTKLNAAVEAGNVPDITMANPYKAVSYYPNNPYMDVTDLVKEIDAARPMFKALSEGTKIENANYFVPFYAASSLLFLRKDLFEAKNIPVPTTWEELWEAAVKVTDSANGVYGLGMGCGPTDEDCENLFRMMMWDNGGSLMDKDGNIVAATDKGLSTMVEKYVELYKAGAIPPSAPTWDPGGNNKSYLMGESAMVVNVPTLYNALKNDPNYAELLKNTVVLNLPAGSAGNVVFGNPVGFAIMADAKNKDNAREFIRYISDKAWYDTYMDAIAPVFAPVYEDSKDSATWKADVNNQALEYIQNATGYYGYPSETLEGRAIAAKNYFSFPIARMLNSVVTGSASVEDAMKQLDKELTDTAQSVK
ncbi:MAG: extracellular solute-binding protein [Oscillospiraceae bacterium]